MKFKIIKGFILGACRLIQGAKADIVGNGAKGVKTHTEEANFYLLHLLDLWSLNLQETAYIPPTEDLQDPMNSQEIIASKLRFMGDDEQAMLVAKLTEIYNFDHLLGLSLLRSLSSFQWAKSPTTLPSTPDNKPVSEGVDLRQIAIRRGGIITLSGPYWDGLGSSEDPTLTSESMVATIVHELIYSLIRPQVGIEISSEDYQQLQSARTAELVGLFFDGPISDRNREDIYETINAELPTFREILNGALSYSLGDDSLSWEEMPDDRTAKKKLRYIPYPSTVKAKLRSGGNIETYPRVFIEMDLNDQRARFVLPLGFDEVELDAELDAIFEYIEEKMSWKYSGPVDPFAEKDPNQAPPTKVDLSELQMKLVLMPLTTKIKIKQSSIYGYRELLWPQYGEIESENDDLIELMGLFSSKDLAQIKDQKVPYKGFRQYLRDYYLKFTKAW